MKKLALVLLASFALTVLMSACSSSAECPAYSQVETTVAVG